METGLMVMQFFIVVALVFVILLQRSGNDGLAGLAGGGHGVVSGKTAANAFTKATAILATAFMLNSLVLAKLHLSHSDTSHTLIQSLESEQNEAQPAKPLVPQAE